jgi:hypothetical protein
MVRAVIWIRALLTTGTPETWQGLTVDGLPEGEAIVLGDGDDGRRTEGSCCQPLRVGAHRGQAGRAAQHVVAKLGTQPCDRGRTLSACLERFESLSLQPERFKA